MRKPGVEAVGLWLERRWAEYLTVVATASLLPLEIIELSRHVTLLRAGGFVVNVAVVIYLVWAKRLFGVLGGVRQRIADLDAVAAAPNPQKARPVADAAAPVSAGRPGRGSSAGTPRPATGRRRTGPERSG